MNDTERRACQPAKPSGEPLRPAPLPEDLAEFLRDKTYACLTQPTDHGTVLVIKAPDDDIESSRGPIPIAMRHELYEHPAAPVIRMVTTLYDDPRQPLRLETNVQDPQQRADFANLGAQGPLLLLFYDEQLRHRLTKQVSIPEPDVIGDVLGRADALLTNIAPEKFDFDQAKEEVMRRASL